MNDKIEESVKTRPGYATNLSLSSIAWSHTLILSYLTFGSSTSIFLVATQRNIS